MPLPERAVRLEQIDKLPDGSSWDLPGDEVYVKFGCIVCPHQVCFVARGVTSEVPCHSINPDDAKDLEDIRYGVEKGASIRRGSLWTWEEPCEVPCDQAEDVQVAVGMLNERFAADLRLPSETVAEQ